MNILLLRKLNGNNKNILLNIILSFFVKGGSLIVTLFTMPSYMHYFDNKSVLGVWFTLLSVLFWILSFDFGIGNGLRNQLVPVLVQKDVNKQRKLISSAYCSLSFLSLLILAGSLLLARLVDWNSVFNIDKQIVPSDLLMRVVMVCFLSIVLQFFLRLVTSILYALQYSFLPSLLGLISTIGLLLFVNISILLGHKNDILFLAWANVFSVNIPLIIATIFVFSKKLKKSIPSIKHFDMKISLDIYKYGLVFLWLQIMALIINNTNDFLITRFVGPSQDVPYQVYAKIFTLVSGIITLAMTPMWSAVTKAKAEKKYCWIRKVYVFLLLLVAVTFVLYLLLMPMLQFVFNIWLGENTIQVHYGYAFVFVMFGTVNVWNGILCCIVNGLGDLKIQTVFMALGAIVNIPLAYLFVQINHSFISIVFANIVSLLPFCIIQTIALFYRFKIIPRRKATAK